MKLTDIILKKDKDILGDRDLMLKERFTDGVVDPQLRREMRRFMFEHKSISFSEFRQLVLRWSDDGANTSQCKVMNASELDTVINEEMILKLIWNDI